MSFDDIQEEKPPWLCEDCAQKCFRVVGWLALVKTCVVCKEEKCDHLFDAEKSLACSDCANPHE